MNQSKDWQFHKNLNILEKEHDWSKVKEKGNNLYKAGSIEPIDLIRSGGLLWDFARGNIIKYAFRLAEGRPAIDKKADLDKIIHYAEMLKAECK